MSSLEEQIRMSVRKTMQADYGQRRRLTAKVDQLAAYLGSLDPPPPVAALRGMRDSQAVIRGQEVFRQVGCDHCHPSPAFTSRETHDVGLEDKEGHAQFNPPSLRGLSQRHAFFHDGRAATLEDAVLKLQHPEPHDVSTKQFRDLLKFLQSL